MPLFVRAIRGRSFRFSLTLDYRQLFLAILAVTCHPVPVNPTLASGYWDALRLERFLDKLESRPFVRVPEK